MDTTPTILGFPLNRIITFVGPYVSLLSGTIASWLLVHVHFLGLFHLQQDGLATGIAQGVVLVLTAGLTWLGQQQWLKGHHIELANGGVNVKPDVLADPNSIPADEGTALPSDDNVALVD